jgi:hypothetical protein
MHIEAFVSVPVPPAQAFAFVSYFGDASWVPGTASYQVEGTGVGALRSITTVDGVELKERLESFDAGAHRYSYRLVEAPMLLENYVSTVEVTPEGGGSRITWQASFEAPAEGADAIRGALEGLFRAAMDGLKSRLA